MRGLLVALNVLLGPTVLASYVWAARTFPDQTTALWGEVPEAVRPAYTANMFLAAAGYLVFTWLLVLRADPANARFFGGRVGSGVVGVAYAMILLGSIVWMPLTSYALEAGRPELVPWIVVDLGVVALGTLLRASDGGARRRRVAAILHHPRVGSAAAGPAASAEGSPPVDGSRGWHPGLVG